jgi:hypothetical protein
VDREERITKLSEISKELWKYMKFYLRDEKLSDELWEDQIKRLDKFAKKYENTEFKSYVEKYILAIQCYLVEIEREKNAKS